MSRRQACLRKRRYESLAAARGAMVRMLEETGTSPRLLHAYGCGRGAAKHYHFGHYERASR